MAANARRLAVVRASIAGPVDSIIASSVGHQLPANSRAPRNLARGANQTLDLLAHNESPACLHICSRKRPRPAQPKQRPQPTTVPHHFPASRLLHLCTPSRD